MAPEVSEPSSMMLDRPGRAIFEHLIEEIQRYWNAFGKSYSNHLPTCIGQIANCTLLLYLFCAILDPALRFFFLGFEEEPPHGYIPFSMGVLLVLFYFLERLRDFEWIVLFQLNAKSTRVLMGELIAISILFNIIAQYFLTSISS